MGLAVGSASANRGADSGSVFGVDPVHVEGDVVAGGAASSHAESFFHDGAHTAFVDVAHGEDADPGAADIFFFDGIDIPDSDENTIFWLHLGGEVEDVGQIAGPGSYDRGERH